jgi:hypothetical protein
MGRHREMIKGGRETSPPSGQKSPYPSRPPLTEAKREYVELLKGELLRRKTPWKINPQS